VLALELHHGFDHHQSEKHEVAVASCCFWRSYCGVTDTAVLRSRFGQPCLFISPCTGRSNSDRAFLQGACKDKAELLRANLLLCARQLAVDEHWDDTRSELRWLVGSRSWKAKVMQQPVRTDSGMRCAIWDGWGFAGEDTDVYLVYSPNDGLRNYSASSLNGLPQPVSNVQRLE
jgi:hypothetical protein